MEDERYSKLREVNPSLEDPRIICVGKYREKNGQDILVDAVAETSVGVTVDFVGPDTTDIVESEQIVTHGFVSEQRLIELFESASLMVFPAPVGAFPVATLEGLCSGLPVVTTPGVGTAALVRGVNPRLIADPTPSDMERAINWYFALPHEQRVELSHRASNYGSGFDEKTGLDAFAFEFANLLNDLGYDATNNA
ncbi:glycosyltransferase family 4 protein [Halobacterium noricense]|uniref:glycosyltransferase family 4 protein n=1 Tax=Halobacterium noricense TaxID=223182 RepID=UPI001E282CE6|nr:glycosyltransferase family 4 protein [Halobacterium noricense]UHH26540.1 glycosyltransferase family 4 protein [Halobacterium noricense]